LNQKRKDDLIYGHFNSDRHRGLEEMEIQLIDHVKGEKKLRERKPVDLKAGDLGAPRFSTTMTDFIIKTRSHVRLHAGDKNISGCMSLVTQF